MNKTELQTLIAGIRSPNASAAEAAADRLDKLTKPRGSLGRFESLAIQLSSISGWPLRPLDRKAVVVMAGDHGVARKGVSAYPAEVTPQMVVNFLQGGAAINVLARRAGAEVLIVDMGIAADLVSDRLIPRKIGYGTNDMSEGPAMTREDALRAIMVGVDLVREEKRKGLDIVATGDMGIGNTTPSSAIVSVLTGLEPKDVTGRGTGIDDRVFGQKVDLIERSISANRPDADDPIDVLAKLGGYEIAGLTGVVLGAAISGIPVVVDGFISTTAALVAGMLTPAAIPYMVAAHRSAEIGHRAALDRLGLEALLDLGFRLGEGTGAAVAFHLIDDAVAIVNEMATFDSAGVSDRC